jgi:hypothetical protein
MKFNKCFYCNNESKRKFCSLKCWHLYRSENAHRLLKIGSYKLDKENFILYVNEKNVSQKRKFEYNCDICKILFITKVGYQLKKEIPWICRSCSTKNQWKTDLYKKSHIIGCKNSFTQERRNNLSISVKKQWNNIDYRNKILSILHSEEVQRKSIRGNKKYKRIYAYGKCFRSKLEYRFATALNYYNIDWQYEPISFKIESINARYYPDFYLPKYNLWIETKGYWFPNAKEKFKMFLKEYAHIKIKIFYEQNVSKIENGILNEIVE